MRTPREIYEAYRIMPNLQEHQLRVAAVSKMICESCGRSVDADSVLLAALFHDMGNILKFDLSYFQEFTADMGLEFWSDVKADYEEKYGSDHHVASVAIAKEIGLSERVTHLISRVTFLNLKEIRDGEGYEQKIVDYADLRVGPHGILSLEERLEEAHARYRITRPQDTVDEGEYRSLKEAAYEIERQLFAQCSIRPEDINDASVLRGVEELWKYPVP